MRIHIYSVRMDDGTKYLCAGTDNAEIAFILTRVYNNRYPDLFFYSVRVH